MSTEQNKAQALRILEDVWNQRNLEVLNEVIAPNFVGHEPTTTIHGVEGARQFTSGYLAAFPDIHFTVDFMVAEGDLVATRWLSSGTHTGELQGMAPTGKHVTSSGTTISRHANGKIVEEWIDWDRLGLLQQLGAIPTSR